MSDESASKRWHNAYQRALAQSPIRGGDGVVRIFEKLVGTPPAPQDREAYQVYLHLLSDLHRMEVSESVNAIILKVIVSNTLRHCLGLWEAIPSRYSGIRLSKID